MWSRALFVYAFVMLSLSAVAQPGSGRSLSWEEAIAAYARLDTMYTGAKLTTIGHDDDGSPIHLFVIADGSGFTPDSIRAAGKNILWLTNAIHAGEPDGIDASLRLAHALLESDQLMGLTVRTAVCIVPVYNVSGTRQRGSFSRANQNGPEEYGFRANARNLDLNRDHMKMDAANTRSILQAIAHWDPDLHFEPHVTDGADHQYIMALVNGRKEKMAPSMATFYEGVLQPGLYRWMERKGHAMCPYFETVQDHPEQGMSGFFSLPRTSTGYHGLFDRFSIISEAHVLKPFAQRVEATYQLMLATLAVMDQHADDLRAARSAGKAHTSGATSFKLNWTLDPATVDRLPWKGYMARYKPSEVTGLSRLWYDHAQPTETTVPWYDSYRATIEEQKPMAYLVPQQWHEAIDRLRWSGVHLRVLERDTVLWAEQDSIAGFTDPRAAYEGHYLHRDISVARKRIRYAAKRGDVLVPMGHASDRYVVEALCARAEDGFFAWNFFDAVLQQKEWYDAYVFEEKAAELLTHDPVLKAAFEAERAKDPAFAKDARAQLTWIYRRSPWMEPGFRKYPVLRVLAERAGG